MICRKAAVTALLCCIAFAASDMAQPGDRSMNTEARVLDILFPLDVTPKPYFSKMILRYGDSDTQLVVIVYPPYPILPGGRAEVIHYSLEGMGDGQLSQLISRMETENPGVKDQEIAAKVKVKVTRSPINYEALDRALRELKAVRISPILANRVAVDECSEYEFWYDTWQESVHYAITCASGNIPQDKLAQWMTRFRANLPALLKAPAPKP